MSKKVEDEMVISPNVNTSPSKKGVIDDPGSKQVPDFSPLLVQVENEIDDSADISFATNKQPEL